jgi:hypothetical protein
LRLGPSSICLTYHGWIAIRRSLLMAYTVT